MTNNGTVLSKFGSFIGSFMVLVLVFGLPVYFMWGMIKEVFDFIPSTRVDFTTLLEAKHGILFYIFAGVVILGGVLFNIIYRVILAIGLFMEDSTLGGRAIAVLFGLVFVGTGLLPYISYFLISDDLYSYYFNFSEMISFIGTFELMFLPILILEAFIGTSFITPVSKVVFYMYLLMKFI